MNKKLTLVTHEDGRRELVPLPVSPDKPNEQSEFGLDFEVKVLAARIANLEREVRGNRHDYDQHLAYGTLGSAVATALFLGAIAYLAWGVR